MRFSLFTCVYMYTHKRSAQIERETLWTRARDDPNPGERRERTLFSIRERLFFDLFFGRILNRRCSALWVFPSLLSFLIIKKKGKGEKPFSQVCVRIKLFCVSTILSTHPPIEFKTKRLSKLLFENRAPVFVRFFFSFFLEKWSNLPVGKKKHREIFLIS